MNHSNTTRLSSGESDWLRLIFLAAGLCIALFSTTPVVVGAEHSSTWRTDFKVAMQEAEQKKLPLLIHFYADWCMPCQKMEREVFSNSDVKELLGNKFVAVKINSDHHKNLVDRYQVQVLPSDVIVNSLTGKVITSNSGYQNQPTYLSNALQAEARFNKIVVTKSAPNNSITRPAVSVQADAIEFSDPKPMLGLDGFSPVALTKNRQWNRGSSKFAWDYKDVTYYLSTAEELAAFRNNPEDYAPKLLGCDAVILWETDKAVAGDIRFGAFFDDELYLFKDEERRRQFKANPEKYIRLQHAFKADQIERTVIR